MSTHETDQVAATANRACRLNSAGGRKAGFTLIELMMTLAILGVLASAVLPLAQVALQRSREVELRRSLREVRNAIDAYKRASDEGRVPKALGSSGYPKDLETLVDGVPDQRSSAHAKLYFLRRVPVDPVADAPSGAVPGWGKRSYASEASDPQDGDDVYDIYSRANGSGLNGIPYRQW